MVNGVPISEELPRATCCVISQIRFCDTICLALKKTLSVDAEPFGGILHALKQGGGLSQIFASVLPGCAWTLTILQSCSYSCSYVLTTVK